MRAPPLLQGSFRDQTHRRVGQRTGPLARDGIQFAVELDVVDEVVEPLLQFVGTLAHGHRIGLHRVRELDFDLALATALDDLVGHGVGDGNRIDLVRQQRLGHRGIILEAHQHRARGRQAGQRGIVGGAARDAHFLLHQIIQLLVVAAHRADDGELEAAVGNGEEHRLGTLGRGRQGRGQHVDLARLQRRDTGRRHQRHDLHRQAEILADQVGHIDVIADGRTLGIDRAERRRAADHADGDLALLGQLGNALRAGAGGGSHCAGGGQRQCEEFGVENLLDTHPGLLKIAVWTAVL